MAFKGRAKVRLNTPIRVREEAGCAYRAWIKNEIDDDELKAAIYTLDKISAMMRGAETEADLAEIKRLVTELERDRDGGHLQLGQPGNVRVSRH